MDECIIPIVFEDPEGNRHVCRTFEEFDEAMGHEDWILVFE